MTETLVIFCLIALLAWLGYIIYKHAPLPIACILIFGLVVLSGKLLGLYLDYRLSGNCSVVVWWLDDLTGQPHRF
jgi:hypothetical protein